MYILVQKNSRKYNFWFSNIKKKIITDEMYKISIQHRRLEYVRWVKIQLLDSTPNIFGVKAKSLKHYKENYLKIRTKYGNKLTHIVTSKCLNLAYSTLLYVQNK